MITHKHHIIPRHAGGSDDPDNIVELTIPAHAEAHRVLWETHNRKEDYIAWKFLSGQANDPQMWLYLSSLGGKTNKGKKHCYHPETGEQTKYTQSVPDGWIAGRNPDYFDRDRLRAVSHDASGSTWYHNPDNLAQCKMILDITDIPSGWIRGRGNSHITENNKTKGYAWWHNTVTGEETTSRHNPGENWLPGKNPTNNHGSHLKLFAANGKGSKWYHNPSRPNETKMVKPGQEPPSGWLCGRPKK